MEIKQKFRFVVSPRFEVFFALQVLTDPGSRIHENWKRAALERLPRSFHKDFAALGGSPFLWAGAADLLENAPLSASVEDLITLLGKLRPAKLQESLFLGIFHEPAIASALVSGKIGVREAVARAGRVKKEWLAFIGLYPVTKDSSLLAGLEWAQRDPVRFRKKLCAVLSTFWDAQFRETWRELRGKLERSCEEKKRLFQSCSLEEFAKLALLRVEIDERRGRIVPIRGGAVLAFKDIAEITVLPSAFNDKRHWMGYAAGPAGEHAYFPYFDPSISVSGIVAPGDQAAEPEADPELICRALGDTTRFAMVSLLARNPLTSASLAKTLALSRPTVSHHIHALREAGLLEEKLQGNAVLLTLRRQALENLSELLTQKLFHSKEEIRLKKTRNK